VQLHVNKAVQDHQRGLPVANAKQTVEQFVTQWLEDTVRPNVRPATYHGYEIQVRVHILPALGKLPLTELGPQHINSWLKQKRDAGLGQRTIQYMHAVLRMALNQAFKWSLVIRNVATLVDPPRVRHLEVRSWTAEQARVFLESIHGHRFEHLYGVILALGLRRGEALALRWANIDLDKRTLTVRGTLQRIGKTLVLGEPKTEKSKRTLKLPQMTVLALRAQRVKQLEARLLAGDRWQETGFVFTSQIGTPIDPRNALTDFTHAVEKAGLPHTRLHDLRHSCISLLLAEGVPLSTVSALAGHSRVSTTADIYAHVTEAQFEPVADHMDRLLGGLG
jgi:integrase